MIFSITFSPSSRYFIMTEVAIMKVILNKMILWENRFLFFGSILRTFFTFHFSLHRAFLKWFIIRRWDWKWHKGMLLFSLLLCWGLKDSTSKVFMLVVLLSNNSSFWYVKRTKNHLTHELHVSFSSVWRKISKLMYLFTFYFAFGFFQCSICKRFLIK